MKPSSSFHTGYAQAAIGAAALLLLAAAPAPGEAQLLVSIRGDDAAALAGLAVRLDARILAAGPAANSLIVRPARPMGWQVLRHGAILVAGPAGGCGAD